MIKRIVLIDYPSIPFFIIMVVLFKFTPFHGDYYHTRDFLTGFSSKINHRPTETY